MPTVIFKSAKKHQAHQQGRLINAFLMGKVFRGELTQQMLDTLEIGIHHLGAMGYERYIDDYEKYSESERYRIFICLLLSNKTTAYHNKGKDLGLVKEIGEKLLKLSPTQIAKAAALTGKLELVQEIRKAEPELDLDYVLINQETLAALGSVNALQKLLTFNVSDSLTVKDFLMGVDLREIYYNACLNGNFDIIQHLEKSKDFDLTAVNKEMAYQFACIQGHLDIVQHLEQSEGFDVTTVNKASDYVAYRLACHEGHLNIVQHLEQTEGFDVKAANKYGEFGSYLWACHQGHLDIIKHIEQSEGFDEAEVNKAYGYETYCLACEGGFLNIVQHLEQSEAFDVTAANKANDYNAYQKACRNGHLNIVKHLEQTKGFDVAAANRAERYGAYSLACRSGHYHIVQHLEQTKGFDVRAANEAYHMAYHNGHLDIIKHLEQSKGFNPKFVCAFFRYGAYRCACSAGHLDIVQHLEQSEGFDVEAANKADAYQAYRYACSNGHLAIVKHLEQSDGFDVMAANKANAYQAYRDACSNGHLAIVQHLEQSDVFDVVAASSAKNHQAYQNACRNGHLEIVKHLEQSKGFDVTAANKANGYEAYQEACGNGHLDIVKHLEHSDGFDLREANKANNYCAYRRANECHRSDVIKHLLSNTDILAYAVCHEKPYALKYISDWVDLKLRNLSRAKDAFHAEHPNDVFNLSNEDAHYYIHILINLISRGGVRRQVQAENTKEAICQLLEIPSIKERCHQQNIEGGIDNELLWIAIEVGNVDAVKLLLGEYDKDLNSANTVRLKAREEPSYIRDLVKVIELVPEEATFFLRSAFSSPKSFNRLIPDDQTLSSLQASLMSIDLAYPELGLIFYEEGGKRVDQQKTDPNIYSVMTCNTTKELFKELKTKSAEDKVYRIIDKAGSIKETSKCAEPLSKLNDKFATKQRISTFFYEANKAQIKAIPAVSDMNSVTENHFEVSWG